MFWTLMVANAAALETTVAVDVDRLQTQSQTLAQVFPAQRGEDSAVVPTGLRAEVGLERLSLVGSAQWSRRRSNHWTVNDSFDAQLNTFVYGLGAKAELDPTPWFSPYVMVQGRLVQGGITLDEDRDDDHNLNVLVERAFAPGFVASGGLDFTLAPEMALSPVAFVEMGYQWSGMLSYNELGDYRFNGFAVRGGIGVAF
jgi:hypothetical protein